jgi:cytidylate kinase
VLSESPLKIYLDASSEMRAKRRSAELESIGQAADYAKILEEINLRDQRDMNRDESPLKKLMMRLC